MNDYIEAVADQEVMEAAYRLLHEFAWFSEKQSKNEFYYALQEKVEELRTADETS